MQECALVREKEQVVLGAAGRLWSGDDTLAIFCGKALIQLMEFDALFWESGRVREKIGV